jgi:hypothetical protein
LVDSLGWPVVASDPAARTMTFTMKQSRFAYSSADANARVVRLDTHAARLDIAATTRDRSLIELTPMGRSKMLMHDLMERLDRMLDES